MTLWVTKNIIIILLLLLSRSAVAQYEYIEESNFGITKEMFSNVNIRDAKAIIEVWTKMIHDYSTKIKKSETYIYDDMKQLEKDINNGKVDLIFLNTIQYLSNKERFDITPYYGTTTNKKKNFNLVLLYNNDLKIKSIRDLKDKKISIYGGRQKTLLDMWLSVLLSKENIKIKEKFFSEIEYDENPSKNLLSVFFGKMDVCLTISSAYETMSELNPQIKSKLSMLQIREGIISDLYCVRNGVSEKYKEGIFEFGEKIDKQPKTKQVYKIFKIDGSYFFDDHDLDKTKALWEEYKNLK